MRRSEMQSWPARVSAVGFIVVIIFGNFALVLALLGSESQRWVNWGLSIGILVTLAGLVGLVARFVVQLVSGKPAEDEQSAVAGSDGSQDGNSV